VNNYVYHRSPGSRLWAVEGPYPSRQVALYRRARLASARNETRIRCYEERRRSVAVTAIAAAAAGAVLVWMSLVTGGL